MTEIGLIWVLTLQVLRLTLHSHSHVQHCSRLRHRVAHRQRLRAVGPRLLQEELRGEGDGVALHAHQLTMKEKSIDNALNGSLQRFRANAVGVERGRDGVERLSVLNRHHVNQTLFQVLLPLTPPRHTHLLVERQGAPRAQHVPQHLHQVQSHALQTRRRLRGTAVETQP